MTKTKIQISTPKRSFTKALVFRILSLIVHFVVIYFFTGEIATSIYLTIVINIISTIAYYINERVWVRIGWGRK